MNYCVMYNYLQKRISTAMQRFDTKIICIAQKKIAHVNNRY